MSNLDLLVGVVITMLIITGVYIQSNNEGQFMPQESEVSPASVATQEPVSPEEIYKMFMCPCCGGTIDSDCCITSIEMKNYADDLIGVGFSKEEVAMKMVLKYGLDSLINESDKEKVMEELIKRAPENPPRIIVEPEVVDLGNVSSTEGELHTVIYVRNVGMSELVIDGLDSSCGCTTTALVVDGVEGPRFSMAMYGTNPVGWYQTLTHGEEAELKVYYNTTFHPELRGSATRIITVFSNDPVDFAKKVTIKLNQVD